MEDERARQILLNAHWDSSGWKKDRGIDPDDLIYAQEAGYLFGPIEAEHDELVKSTINARTTLRVGSVADAFLASLTSRDLARRSALGSFAVAQHLPLHTYESAAPRHPCAICGLYPGRHIIDRNVLKFERHKWGGVRRLDLQYVSFDLEQFSKLEVRRSAAADLETLRRTLVALDQAPETVTGSQAQQLLSGMLPSNKSERNVVVQILSVCGVLEDPEHPGFERRFIPERERTLPDLRFMDIGYPAVWWRGEHGVNKRASSAWFPEL